MLLLMMIIGVGGVKADEVTFDATTDVTETVDGYYSDVKSYEASDGSVWKATGHSLKKGDNITIGKGGANYLETPEVNGTITSITVTWKGNTKYYLALQTIEGVELNFKNNPSSTEYKTETFTVDGNYKQLRLVGRRSSGTDNAAAYIKKVVVTYAPAIPYTITLGDDNTTLTETSAGVGVELPVRENVGVYTFAGWSEISLGSEETTTKPDYVNAGNYYPSKDVTLYPVYTRLEGSGEIEEVLAQTLQYDTWSYKGSTTDKSTYRLFHSGSYVESAQFDLGSLSKVVVYGGTFGGSNYNKLTIGDGENIWKVVTVSGSSQTGKNTYIDGAALSGNGKLRVTSNSGTASSNGVRISKIEIYVNQVVGVIYYIQTPNTETPVQKVDIAALNSITPTTLNVNDKGEFTLDATFAEGTTADEDYEVRWESDNAEVLAVSGASYEAKKEGTANVTVKVTVLDEEKYNEVSKSFAVTVNAPNAPGTQNNPYTVAQALAASAVKDVYVKGIVSKIEELSTQYGNATYYISDDGETETEIKVYRGKYLNNESFTAVDQLQVKDAVVIFGEIKPYNNVNQLAQGNYLFSLYRKEKVDAGLAWSAEQASAVRGETFAAPSLTNPYNVVVSYKSSNTKVATIDETGHITLLKAGETTITATFAGDDDYNAAEVSYTLTVTVPSHFATFFVNGQQQGEPVTVAEDETITFPTVAEELFGKQFVGWTTKAIDGETNDKPATLVNAATMGTADVTYYAVFANMISGSSASLTKMTSSDTFGAGDKVVIVADEENVAMYQETVNKTYVNKYTFVNDVSKVAADDKNWFSVSAGSSDGTWKLGDETNGYVYTSSSNNLSIDSDNSTDFTLAWNNDENKFTLVGNGRWLSYRSDLAADNQYFRMGGATTGNSSGDIYFDIYKFTSGSATYSDYCTTVVAPVKPAKPIVFHDSGEYEEKLTVTIAGENVKYTLNDGDELTYTAPFTISKTTTVKAWTEQDGAMSEKVTREYTIVEKAKGAVVEDGYYTIQNEDGKYVNVAGRKTVTLVSDTKSAGTVIRVKADEDGVKVLRSQAVDLPRYAERAMSYVPEIVKEVVKKLAANVDDPIIGEQGADLILDKFKKEFDYHLYLEGENNTYRIYGRTPSMKPVVDFYAENKELIDGRLLKVEGFVKEVLQKVVDKVGRGQSVVDMFKVKTIWQNMGGTLTEPTDDASTLKFYEEVLSSETNVWNFAYQTGMLYWEKVKGYLTDNISELGDYGKYIEKIPQIRPNFRYYIVPGENGVDIISEGNSQITDASTAWTLTKREGFDVTFDATLSKNNGKEMYKTLYVDFAYELPENENVKALKVESVSDAGVAVTKEITGVVPAQTPVLLMSTDMENLTKALKLSTADGAAVTNELKGNDWLINEFEINTPQLETIFALLTKLSSSLGEKYEYLKRKNSGTVNNKYFFGLSVPTEEGKFKEAFMNGKIKVLTNGERGLGFYSNFDKNLVGNEVFMFSEDANPILLTLKGDVNRDGKVSVADVNALVEIVLGKVTVPDNTHDFDAAHVNADEEITIADVTALVNIILGK